MKISAFLLGLCLSFSVLAAKVVVDVKGMSCGMCVEAITKELKATNKAEQINVSLEKNQASFKEVKGKTLVDSEIKAAIKKAGYEAVKISRK